MFSKNKKKIMKKVLGLKRWDLLLKSLASFLPISYNLGCCCFFNLLQSKSFITCSLSNLHYFSRQEILFTKIELQKQKVKLLFYLRGFLFYCFSLTYIGVMKQMQAVAAIKNCLKKATLPVTVQWRLEI